LQHLVDAAFDDALDFVLQGRTGGVAGGDREVGADRGVVAVLSGCAILGGCVAERTAEDAEPAVGGGIEFPPHEVELVAGAAITRPEGEDDEREAQESGEKRDRQASAHVNLPRDRHGVPGRPPPQSSAGGAESDTLTPSL